jgi:acetyltransferase-like isoleucine patch superfamily enzyme
VIKALKYLYWDISDPYTRFQILNTILGLIPGRFGAHLREIWIPRHFKHAGESLRIFEGVRFRGMQNLSVGNRVHIGVDCFLQASGGIEIGDNVILGPGVKIWSMNHIYNDPDTPVHDQGYEKRAVRIGDDVWIGANAFIMPGADIGDGTVISANSVVGGKTIPPFSILAGNPARKIGIRKKDEGPNEGPASVKAESEESARAKLTNKA